VRAKFEEKVRTENPNMFVFYDHGSEDAWWGSDGKELMDYDNVGLAGSREVFTLACLCAKRLGSEAYRRGCRAFWGYTEAFAFTTDQEEAFGRLANMGLILKVKNGLSWGEAVQSVKAAFTAEIERMREEGGNGWAVIAMIGDRDSLVCWTADSEPPSDCRIRNLGIKLFGRAGQKMTKTATLLIALFFSLYTGALYGYLNLLYDRHKTVLVFDSGYLGMLGLLVVEVAILSEYMRVLDQR